MSRSPVGDAVRARAALANACRYACDALPKKLPSDDGSELASGDLSALRTGGMTLQAFSACEAVWTDVYHAYPVPSAAINCALLRTVEVVEQTLLGSRPGVLDSREAIALSDALSRAFSSWAGLDRSVVDSAPFALARNALIEIVQASQARPVRLAPLTLGWVSVANSICAVWPGHVPAVFGFLANPGGVCAAYLQYISVLGFPQRDHPLSPPHPILLWDRYAMDERVVWTAGDVGELAGLLSDSRIAGGLSDAAKWATDNAYALELSACLELAHVQLSIDLPVRRTMVLRNLRAPNPPRWWNDEYGGQ